MDKHYIDLDSTCNMEELINEATIRIIQAEACTAAGDDDGVAGLARDYDVIKHVIEHIFFITGDDVDGLVNDRLNQLYCSPEHKRPRRDRFEWDDGDIKKGRPD